jgi:hypothetical protein
MSDKGASNVNPRTYHHERKETSKIMLILCAASSLRVRQPKLR